MASVACRSRAHPSPGPGVGPSPSCSYAAWSASLSAMRSASWLLNHACTSGAVPTSSGGSGGADGGAPNATTAQPLTSTAMMSPARSPEYTVRLRIPIPLSSVPGRWPQQSATTGTPVERFTSRLGEMMRASARWCRRSGPELALQRGRGLLERTGIRAGREVLPPAVADDEADVGVPAGRDLLVGD